MWPSLCVDMFSFTLNENLGAELLSPTYKYVAFPGGAAVNNSPANAGDAGVVGSISGWEDPLEKEMATHSSILAWEIPWTEESESGRL